VVGIRGCFDFAEGKTIALGIGVQTDKVSSREAGAALSLVTSVWPREEAGAMIAQPSLGNRLSDPPVFYTHGTGKYAPQAFLLKRGLGNSAQYLFNISTACFVKLHSCHGPFNAASRSAPDHLRPIPVQGGSPVE